MKVTILYFFELFKKSLLHHRVTRCRPFLRCAHALTLSLVTFPVWAIVCSEDANQAIPDGSGNSTPGAAATVSIVVPAAVTPAITDLNFQLQIDHTYVGDLIVTLTSPAGTVVTLINRPGSPTPLGIFGCSNNNIDTTLDDAAATAAETQCNAVPPAVGGTQQPTGSLASFNGESLAGTWVVSVTDNAGQDLGTLIAGGACLDPTTTPVTISSFKSIEHGSSIITQWQTSSEAFNLGFNLWGLMDEQWTQLNGSLIASRTFDSVVPQNYRHRIRTEHLDGEITQIGISAYSTSGQEDFFGPFEIGEKYGDDEVARYIDWGEQRRHYDQSMRDAGFMKLDGRWVPATSRRLRLQHRQQSRFPDVIFSIAEAGVYKVSYEYLRSLGINLNRMPIRKMALSLEGQPVPRIITSAQRRGRRFGPGSFIEFYAHPAVGSDSRYVPNAHYKLSLNPALVLKAPSVNGEQSLVTPDASAADFHRVQQTGGTKNSYSFVLPGHDPWYDSIVQAFGQIQSKGINITVAQDALLDQPSVLSMNLLGGVDFTNIDADDDGVLNPDHHFRVYVNRTEFPDAILENFSEGIDPISIQVGIPPEQLKIGDNSVEFELIPDNGFNIDAAFLIDASIVYSRPNKVSDGPLDIALSDESEWLRVDDPGNRIEHAYRYDDDGNFAQTSFYRDNQTQQLWLESQPNPSATSKAHIWLAGQNDYLSPDQIFRLETVNPDELDLSEVDYVVISDPSLIGPDLQRFVERQGELGRRTKVVNSQSIFATYSDGLVIPDAIADYLADQSQISDYQYVLLVGGHTYNYRGYGASQDNQPINFIPAFYRPTGKLIKQTPTAVPFVDFDGDGAPDRAIGRWPVRDQIQLKNVVDKTLRWHAEGSHASSKTALFIAGEKRPLNNFSASSNRVMQHLGLQYNPWTETKTVYMDDINNDATIPQEDKLSAARQAIINGVNQGAALTVFSGHASTTRWSFQSLVTANVADSFTNSENPSLMVPLACYTSYYETPQIKSLAEILLADNAAGAVGISSAAVLSRASDNEQMAKQLAEEMTVAGSDLGTAVLNIKKRLHIASPRYQSLVFNWTTLADPTLSFSLPDVRPLPVMEPGK